jgi:serine/threonine-protein kinase PknG
MTLFERCYFEMPGELAPRLAMGVAAEVAGQFEQALPYYDRVGQVDPSYVSAHAGAARCYARAGRLHESVATLGRVPDNHAMHARTLLVVGEMLLTYPALVDSTLLQRAEAAVGQALSAGGHAYQIAARLLSLAVARIRDIAWPGGATFLGVPFSEGALRMGAEDQYRRAAREASSQSERFHWIGEANRVRPVTLF